MELQERVIVETKLALQELIDSHIASKQVKQYDESFGGALAGIATVGAMIAASVFGIRQWFRNLDREVAEYLKQHGGTIDRDLMRLERLTRAGGGVRDIKAVYQTIDDLHAEIDKLDRKFKSDRSLLGNDAPYRDRTLYNKIGDAIKELYRKVAQMEQATNEMGNAP